MTACDSIQFFVEGRPAPGGSKRPFVNQYTGKVSLVDMGKGNKAWKKSVAKAGKDAFPEPLKGPLVFTMTFVMKRPKCHYRTGRYSDQLREDAPDYPTVAPDTTKLVRAAEDGLKGVAWFDDSQVVAQHAYKTYGTNPGVWIEVSPYDGKD